MDSTKKYPLQKQHIQTMVRDELEGFRGLVKQLLGQKIGFYEAQQESTKQNTPGVALASATTANVQFMISFQEQLDEVKLEITTAPSNETVRRLKALVASAKSTFPKLQTSDIKKVLDLLLECVPYTMIKPNRTKGRDQKPEVEATGPSDLAQGKGGEVRRLIQDYVIKTVYTLASQFLPGADYPKNLEEYRDYFDLSKKGEELAETINYQLSTQLRCLAHCTRCDPHTRSINKKPKSPPTENRSSRTMQTRLRQKQDWTQQLRQRLQRTQQKQKKAWTRT